MVSSRHGRQHETVYAVIALMVTTLTAAAMWQSYRLGRAGGARDAAEQQLGEYKAGRCVSPPPLSAMPPPYCMR